MESNHRPDMDQIKSMYEAMRADQGRPPAQDYEKSVVFQAFAAGYSYGFWGCRLIHGISEPTIQMAEEDLL